MHKNILLFCLPYAGGSATSFSNITFRLSNNIQVEGLELPGRGSRYLEPLSTDLNEIVADLYQLMYKSITNLKQQVFIWGHSMGAIVGLLLANKLKERKDLDFGGLIVSAMTGPIGINRSERKLHLLPDAEFIEYFSKLVPMKKGMTGGDMLESVLEKTKTVLRADIAALENFKVTDWISVTIDEPIHVLIGQQDEIMPNLHEYDSWELQTSSHTKHYLMSGGHFFVLEHPAKTAVTIQQIINKSISQAS